MKKRAVRQHKFRCPACKLIIYRITAAKRMKSYCQTAGKSVFVKRV